MEALLISIPIGVAIAFAAWLLVQVNRSKTPPGPAPELVRIGEQVAGLGEALSATQQAVAESQRTLLQQLNEADARHAEQMRDVRGELTRNFETVDGKVTHSLTSTNATIGKIGEQLGGLGEQLGGLSDATKRIVEAEQNLGRDVSSLKDVLQPPKLRGAFGEMQLRQLLEDTLPAAKYSTQHRFGDNSVVDFVIHTPDGLVPIDSKFPAETFKRLLNAGSGEEEARERRTFIREMKSRVDEVARYVRPDEGTLEFAIMYIPAENIYYEALVGADNESVMDYALQRHVHLASPNTFHALLQTVRRIFTRLDIQKNAMEIQGRLDQLKREYTLFREEFRKLGLHVSHAKNKFDDVERRANRFGDRLSLATQSELPALDEALQAPLPQADIAPAPLVPSLTNGNGHSEDPD